MRATPHPMREKGFTAARQDHANSSHNRFFDAICDARSANHVWLHPARIVGTYVGINLILWE